MALDLRLSTPPAGEAPCSDQLPRDRLIQLLSIYPILEVIVPMLSFAELLHLSRSSTTYRAVLHGFDIPSSVVDPALTTPDPETNLRLVLSIHNAQTAKWVSLKKLSQFVCAEPTHKRGGDAKACRLCSMPVCIACIVRASFSTTGNAAKSAFTSRRRHLCDKCWEGGEPHAERAWPVPDSLAYSASFMNGAGPPQGFEHGDTASPPRQQYQHIQRRPADMSVLLNYKRMPFCECSANDGHLCLRCRKQQIERGGAASAVGPDLDSMLCAGRNCNNLIGSSLEAGGRVCVWCENPLAGVMNMDERRQEYELRNKNEFKSCNPAWLVEDSEKAPKRRNRYIPQFARMKDGIYDRMDKQRSRRRSSNETNKFHFIGKADPANATSSSSGLPVSPQRGEDDPGKDAVETGYYEGQASAEASRSLVDSEWNQIFDPLDNVGSVECAIEKATEGTAPPKMSGKADLSQHPQNLLDRSYTDRSVDSPTEADHLLQDFQVQDEAQSPAKARRRSLFIPVKKPSFKTRRGSAGEAPESKAWFLPDKKQRTSTNPEDGEDFKNNQI